MNKTDKIKALYANRRGLKSPSKTKPMLTPSHKGKARLNGEHLRLVFPTDKTLISFVKKFDQKQFIKGDKNQVWEIPLSLDNINKLEQNGFELSDKIKKWKCDLFAPVKFNPNFSVPNLKQKLLPYQIEGVQIIEAKQGKVLLADDQGLGKTAQAIAWTALHPEKKPVLIICPAMLKGNWELELDFWLKNPKTQIITGTQKTPIWGEYVIINYDILTKKEGKENVIREELWNTKWKVLILDEAHYISNRQSIRGWAIEQLVKRIPHVIPITATPGKNRPKEIFTLINYVNPYLFPSFYRYAHRYCGPRKGFMGNWVFEGSSNEFELNDILSSTIMIRRKKTEIFKELDKKIRQVIPIEINNRKEYDKADNDFTSWVLENRPNSANKAFKAAALYKFMLLEQIAVEGKIKACIEYLENLLETEEKVVAFAEHKVVIENLQKHFKNIAVVVDGSTPPKQREEAKQLFQQCSRCKVRKEKHNFDKNACESFQYNMQKRLFISSSTGKEGNTLTAAYHVVFIELWWSPVDHDQAEDRVYGRAGDLHGGVMHYMIAKDTVEEHKAKIFDLKNEMLTKVLDGKGVSKEYILRELLKRR